MLCHMRVSHVQLCDPMDGSPPGSSVLGILQSRVLEWVETLCIYISRHLSNQRRSYIMVIYLTFVIISNHVNSTFLSGIHKMPM